jgi:BirA family transcriptional regulator, biotin operon repressor / biotin---[acetyl-CoA-carboxylase] ligase
MPSSNGCGRLPGMNATGAATEELRQFVQRHELPLRRRFDGDRAATILRYGAFVGSVIEHHASLGRAMDHARAHIVTMEEGNRSVAGGTVIVAGSLSGSRGRFSRSWFAPTGGLWGCLIHANTLLPGSRRFLSLAAGVACCEAIRQEGAADACLRWVNDVLIAGKKVAGFLIQGFSGPSHHDEYDLIGFGININNRSFPDELQNSATSLAEEVGYPVDLHHFTLVFLAKLTWNLGLLYFEEANDLRGDGFSGRKGEHMLLERWKELSDTIGKRVIFGENVFENHILEAQVTGLGGDGCLMLQLDDGSSIVLQSGEIRIEFRRQKTEDRLARINRDNGWTAAPPRNGYPAGKVAVRSGAACPKIHPGPGWKTADGVTVPVAGSGRLPGALSYLETEGRLSGIHGWNRYRR